MSNCSRCSGNSGPSLIKQAVGDVGGNAIGSAAAPVQRVVHRPEDLVDGDPAVVVPIGGFAVEQRCVAKSDVHHCEDVVDGHLPVAGAVAYTRRRGRRWCYGVRRCVGDGGSGCNCWCVGRRRGRGGGRHRAKRRRGRHGLTWR